MQRRDLLKVLAGAGLLPSAGLFSQPAHAATARYNGPIYLVLSAEGGWDVTSLCDPKDGLIMPPGTTTPVRINNWSASESIQTSANGIRYAPFADNARLFTDHSAKMLVINGLDAQTNAHSAGVRHVFSGRFADGYPAITALAAAEYGAGLPLAFLSNGAYRETAGLTNFSLMQDPASLGKLINTNSPPWGASQYIRPDVLPLLEQYRRARLDRLQARAGLVARLKQSAAYLDSSAAGRDQLTSLNQYMPETLAPTQDANGDWFPLLRQIQLVLVSAAAGLTVAADVVQHGFDSHANHDVEQARGLTHLTAGIDFIWAEAARMDALHGTELVSRLRVVVASDFGRTPWYNDGAGKDHWPIGSAILMRNSGFGQSVVGATSAEHDALGLSSQLIAQTDGTGTLINPAHFQRLLRYWSGTDKAPYNSRFVLDDSGLDLRALV